MVETKYTMIGMSGAGKTGYLTAMYMKMAAGFDGFTLVTNDHTSFSFEEYEQHISENYKGDPVFDDIEKLLSNLYRFGIVGCENFAIDKTSWNLTCNADQLNQK